MTALIAVAGVAAALVGVTAAIGGAQEEPSSTTAGDDGDKITLTVGLTQDMDTPNVTVGQLVASFETWNLEYATLTDKAADDFAITPGLAESWEASDDGLTYTYTLRDGLEWSDGEPLTAEDIAYTVNRSREEEWINHFPTTQNLEATALDARTVEITSSKPDPRLPQMDVYIVPKHIYEDISADALPEYDALDGVGSGPFTLEGWQTGQSWRMAANDSYWGGRPVVDEIVFRPFTNGDAMVEALLNGEIDAAHNIPSQRVEQLRGADNIEVIEGDQGSFDELLMNAGDGLGGHPALADVRVRQAIAHAIDKQTIVDRVLRGLGTPVEPMSVSPDPKWMPEIPEDERFDFDLAEANSILDEAGYEDTDGDGVREMPGGGQPLSFVYAERSESNVAASIREFITGWLDEIGIATDVQTYNDSQLIRRIGQGDVDISVWGWFPYVDPDGQLVNFLCNQIATAEDPTAYLNDANWCNEEYDRLYDEQHVELDPERRVEIVHDMLRLFYEEAPYVVLYVSPDLQAYRTDRFEGWLRQPKDVGPVMFSNTSPSYAVIVPAGSGEETASGEGGGSGDDDSNLPLVLAIAAGGIIVIGGGALLVARRRGGADERE